jgi:hypothetical protein
MTNLYTFTYFCISIRKENCLIFTEGIIIGTAQCAPFHINAPSFSRHKIIDWSIHSFIHVGLVDNSIMWSDLHFALLSRIAFTLCHKNDIDMLFWTLTRTIMRVAALGRGGGSRTRFPTIPRGGVWTRSTSCLCSSATRLGAASIWAPVAPFTIDWKEIGNIQVRQVKGITDTQFIGFFFLIKSIWSWNIDKFYDTVYFISTRGENLTHFTHSNS